MSSLRVQAILGLVAELDDDERAELHDELNGDYTEEWKREWTGELGRRAAEIERGEAELLTKEQFLSGFWSD